MDYTEGGNILHLYIKRFKFVSVLITANAAALCIKIVCNDKRLKVIRAVHITQEVLYIKVLYQCHEINCSNYYKASAIDSINNEIKSDYNNNLRRTELPTI